MRLLDGHDSTLQIITIKPEGKVVSTMEDDDGFHLIVKKF
jgi:hypothetical protein